MDKFFEFDFYVHLGDLITVLVYYLITAESCTSLKGLLKLVMDEHQTVMD
jgi:hypothetical protein